MLGFKAVQRLLKLEQFGSFIIKKSDSVHINLSATSQTVHFLEQNWFSSFETVLGSTR